MKKHLPRASSNAAQAAQGAVDAVKDAATDTSDRSSAHIAREPTPISATFNHPSSQHFYKEQTLNSTEI
jgi:hypothetical protein